VLLAPLSFCWSTWFQATAGKPLCSFWTRLEFCENNKIPIVCKSRVRKPYINLERNRWILSTERVCLGSTFCRSAGSSSRPQSERARHQELDTGATVLHCAASDDRLDLVQRLLVRRADANSIDKAGRTPLMRAMDNANWFVSLVLSKFTDPRHMTKTMITCMNQKKDTVIATTNAIATSTSLPRCICDIISEYNIHSGFDTESSEE
jgi:hypothetical protein